MTPTGSAIPESAKSTLATMLNRCLEECLRSDGYASWTLQPVESTDEITAEEFNMLTISSYDFRMFVLLHSSRSAPALRYAADALQLSQDQITPSRYYDFLGELGNRFCGAFKRDLGASFPYTGMSTPNRLLRESLKHLKNITHACDMHVRARADDATCFYASLYVSSYSAAEFRIDLPKLEEHTESGELELF